MTTRGTMLEVPPELLLDELPEPLLELLPEELLLDELPEPLLELLLEELLLDELPEPLLELLLEELLPEELLLDVLFAEELPPPQAASVAAAIIKTAHRIITATPRASISSSSLSPSIVVLHIKVRDGVPPTLIRSHR